MADSTEPRDGVPAVITTDTEIRDFASRIREGSGPIAIDAERASGYRYSQRAYLLQIRRRGSGTALIDPIPIADFDPLIAAMADEEWILHAATQDLPCLAELGFTPTRVFDTELAGRLLGRERVGLAALVESELGEFLEKGHGAADWSKRPIDPAMLRYAALDVEHLLELRDVLAEALEDAGKSYIASQEFERLLSFQPRPVGPDPWRRTSGLHRARKPRQLAVVREMWSARDEIARSTDTAPGRILPDSAILVAATGEASSPTELLALEGFHGRGAAKYADRWWGAVTRARSLAGDALPAPSPPASGPPAPRTWEDRNPEAHARLTRAKEVLAQVSESVSIPVENLLTPELVRQVCWDGPSDLAGALGAGGARPWQIALVAPLLESAWLPEDPGSE